MKQYLKCTSGIKGWFNEDRLSRLEPFHASGQLNNAADGFAGSGWICILCNCCGAVCISVFIQNIRGNLLIRTSRDLIFVVFYLFLMAFEILEGPTNARTKLPHPGIFFGPQGSFL